MGSIRPAVIPSGWPNSSSAMDSRRMPWICAAVASRTTSATMSRTSGTTSTTSQPSSQWPKPTSQGCRCFCSGIARGALFPVSIHSSSDDQVSYSPADPNDRQHNQRGLEHVGHRCTSSSAHANVPQPRVARAHLGQSPTLSIRTRCGGSKLRWVELLLVAHKEEDGLRRYLRERVLELYLQDNVQARELQSDVSHTRCAPDGNSPRDA